MFLGLLELDNQPLRLNFNKFDLFNIDETMSELRFAASPNDPMAIDYLSRIHFAISAIEDFRRIEIFLKKRFHVLSKRFAAQP